MLAIKLFLCIFTIIAISACQNSSIQPVSTHDASSPVPMVSASATSTPLPVATPTLAATATPIPGLSPTGPTPTPKVLPADYLTYQQHSEGRYCEPLKPLAEIQPRLRFPIDVAVSSDGESVYVVNQRCDTNPSVPPFAYDPLFKETFMSDCYGEYVESENLPSVIERIHIYQIQNGKLKRYGPNDSALTCQMSDEIEMGLNQELLTTNLVKGQLLSISSNTLELTHESNSSIREPNFQMFNRGGNPASLHSIPYQKKLLTTYSGGTFGRAVFQYIFDQSQKVKKLDFLINNYYMISYTFRDARLGNNPQKEQLIVSYGQGPIYYGERSQFYPHQGIYKILIGGSKESTNQTIGFKDGSAQEARFGGVYGFRWASATRLYVTDTKNHAIRRIDFANDDFFPEVEVTTLAGNGESGLQDGLGREAQFNFPTNLDIDASGNLYIADTGNHAIRKITPQGEVTTLYAETNAKL